MDKHKKEQMHKVDDILHTLQEKMKGDLPDELIDNFCSGLYLGADATYDDVYGSDESDKVKELVWLNNIETLKSMFRINDDREHRKQVINSMNITLAHLKAFIAMVGLVGVSQSLGSGGKELLDEMYKTTQFLSKMYVNTIKQFEEMFGDEEE